MQRGRWCYDEVMCIVIEGPELTLVNFDNTLNIFNENKYFYFYCGDYLKLTIT